MKYFKVINASKTDGCGIYYKEGVLESPVLIDGNQDPCYYTDAKNIFHFLNDGCYLIEMENIEDSNQKEINKVYDTEFGTLTVRVPVWYTFKFKCVKMWRLDKASTIQMLLKEGADPKAGNYALLKNSIIHHYGIFKFCKDNWEKIAKEPWEVPQKELERSGYYVRSCRDLGWEGARSK